MIVNSESVFFCAQFYFQKFKNSTTFLPNVVIASEDVMPFCVIVMLVLCSNCFLVDEEFAVLFVRLENVSFS